MYVPSLPKKAIKSCFLVW